MTKRAHAAPGRLAMGEADRGQPHASYRSGRPSPERRF